VARLDRDRWDGHDAKGGGEVVRLQRSRSATRCSRVIGFQFWQTNCVKDEVHRVKKANMAVGMIARIFEDGLGSLERNIGLFGCRLADAQPNLVVVNSIVSASSYPAPLI
jgi:hypothetical protein